MDERGTGILRMEQFMEKWDLEKPTYNEEDGYFVITFKGPVIPEVFVPRSKFEELNERQKTAVEYIKRMKSISRKEYIEINSVSHTTAQKELKNLVEKKMLETVGGGKYLRYRLTQG